MSGRILILGLAGVLAGLSPLLAAEEVAVEENYALLPNDLVQVKVFQEDDLATTTRVANDGNILVPLIGSVHVGGGGVHDASQLIRQKLKNGYLVNPQVNVTVLEFSKRRLTVIGQVQKGGTYIFPEQGKVDLLQAIGMAGGYSKLANPAKVTVRRSVDGKETVFRVNAKAMAAGERPFEILPGDVVTVAERIF